MKTIQTIILISLCLYMKAQQGIINTFAGSGNAGYVNNTGVAAEFNYPAGHCFDSNGNLFVADEYNHVIRKISPSGVVTTVAGTYSLSGGGFPVGGFGGDGGQATAAKLNSPRDVFVTPAGVLYIADQNNNRIRKVAVNGIITTVAGSGIAGSSPNGTSSTAAQLNHPIAVALSPTNELHYLESFTSTLVRKVNTLNFVQTVCGGGTGPDGGFGTTAGLSSPKDIAFDGNGNLYIAEYGRVRKIMYNVETSVGIISTAVGTSSVGFYGDGGQATNAWLGGILNGLFVDASNNIYLSDFMNNRIRMVTSSGIIYTIAGNGTSGFSGDGGLATDAEITTNNLSGISVAANGTVYYSDSYRIRFFLPLPVIPTTDQELNTSNLSDAFPNPTNNEVTIQYNFTKDEVTGKINIYDTYGKTIKTFNVDNTFDSIILDTKELSAGVYYYSLITKNGESFSKKIIVSKQ